MEQETGQEIVETPERTLEPAVTKTTRQYAYSWGKAVIRELEKIGASKESVEVSRKRMREWLELIEKYKGSVREVFGDPKLKQHEKAALVSDMYDELEKQRARVFGA